jgi:hypothetical protein
MRSIIATLLTLASCVGVVATARAAESYQNCTGFIDTLPATLSTQGTWCLRKDLSTAMTTGAAITLASNNITLDCNDFRITGLLAGPATRTIGIRSQDAPRNLTVRNCTVRGFHTGIHLSYSHFYPSESGGGHRVLDNRLDLNTTRGVRVVGLGSLIKGNLVLDTGGASQESTIIGINATYGVDVIDNTVSGLQPALANGSVHGIEAQWNSGTVRGNRVRGLVKKGTGTAVGIYAGTNMAGDYQYRPMIRDNDLLMEYDTAGSIGIGCLGNEASQRPQTGRAKDNVVVGFATPVDGCGDGGGNDLH